MFFSKEEEVGCSSVGVHMFVTVPRGCTTYMWLDLFYADLPYCLLAKEVLEIIQQAALHACEQQTYLVIHSVDTV